MAAEARVLNEVPSGGWGFDAGAGVEERLSKGLRPLARSESAIGSGVPVRLGRRNGAPSEFGLLLLSTFIHSSSSRLSASLTYNMRSISRHFRETNFNFRKACLL